MSEPVIGRWRPPTLAGDLVSLRPTTAGGGGDHRLDLAVVDLATGEPAGEVVLDGHDPGTDSASLRVSLRDPDRHDRGLRSEAARLVVDHALRTMRLARLTVEDGEERVEVRRSHLDPDYPVLTERLLLRPIDPARDLAAMHAYRSRDDVCRYTPLVPGTVEELADRLADPERTRSVIDAEGQVVALVVEHRDTGAVIGDVVLFWHDATDGHAEIGYVLHPDHSGQGYATEAGEALLGLAFGGLRAHRVTAHIDARNTASAAVARRLGMRHEATYVDGEWFKGEWTTPLVFGLLRREWESRRG